MIHIDGSQGEGGGQVLRSGLTLAMMTGGAMRITDIRAGRPKPGLRAQHLKAVQAAAAVAGAHTDGARLGSTELTFEPGTLRPGDYRFDIGTAGSTALVLQTIFLPLSAAGAPSTLTIIGGTHVPWSPCYHYLDLQWLPLLRQAGFDARVGLESAGFYPRGGGCIRATIRPVDNISPLRLVERGRLKLIRGISAVANLSPSIAERQRRQAERRLGGRFPLEIEVVRLPGRFKGTMLLLLAEFEGSQCCYFGLGEIGKPAERVADEAVDALEAFLSTDGAVDQYLADQLILPLAFARGESRIRTSRITRHLLTNAQVLRAFLPLRIDVEGEEGKPGLVRIAPSQPETPTAPEGEPPG